MLWSLGVVAIIADLCFRQWGGDFDLAKRVVRVVDVEKLKITSIGVIRIHLNLNESDADLDDSAFHIAKTTIISTDSSNLAPSQSDIDKRSDESSELGDNGDHTANPPFANKYLQNNDSKVLEEPSHEATMGLDNINQESSSESNILENGMGVNSMNQEYDGSKILEMPAFDAGLEGRSLNQGESKNIDASPTQNLNRPDDINPEISDGGFIETQAYGEPLAPGINQPNNEGGFLETQAFGEPLAPGINQPNNEGGFPETQAYGEPLTPGRNQLNNEGGFLDAQEYGRPMAQGMNQLNREDEFLEPQAYRGPMEAGYMNQPNNEDPNFEVPSNNHNAWFNGAGPNDQSRSNMLGG
ncbi:unnamed protein product [Orchesella dallaii]|uniref:Uncharacterized protein n=1 Tax=Orchesella dallaii TaxID=48710 RepID=A0ABP1RTJ6_9HEXA